MMARILMLIVTLAAPIMVNAVESGSRIAWTTETLKLVKNGNAEKGKNLAESCKACHGERGEGMKAEARDDGIIPAVPALAGQVANYTFKQLRDYFNGDRTNESMTSIAKGLAEQDAADVAVWYASLSTPKHKASNQNVAGAEKMVKEGDGKRILPPCFVCHGTDGQGEKIDIPNLAGQQADYFEETMMAFRNEDKNGQRHNDIYSRMRLIAKQLSVDEIKALAAFYQQIE